jgi:hypothetical protein
MRAHEFINEILSIDDPAPETKWTKGGYTEFDKFWVPTNPNTNYATWKDPTGQVVRQQFDKDPNAGSVTTSFTRRHPDEYHARDSITGTGQGKQAGVFTGVARNIKDYMDQNPDTHTYKFNSKDPSRTKAYSRMIDRLAPKAGLVGTQQSSADPSSPTQFVLSRAQPGQQHVPLVAPKSATPPAAAPKLPLPPGRAIPPSMINKAFTPGPSLAGSHGSSPNAQAFQDNLDLIKRKMPRI